jgi:phosphoenolpyruvate carboxykinase (ATP)
MQTRATGLLPPPPRTWDDAEACDRQTTDMAEMFQGTFDRYVFFIDEDIRAAAMG